MDASRLAGEGDVQGFMPERHGPDRNGKTPACNGIRRNAIGHTISSEVISSGILQSRTESTTDFGVRQVEDKSAPQWAFGNGDSAVMKFNKGFGQT